MANEETIINNEQIDINNTIGMKLNANQAELYSKDGKVPIFAKCGENEIKLIDENGSTYLNSLIVGGRNINDMSDEISKILNVFKNATWYKYFSINASGNRPGNDAETAGSFQLPFKGASYIIVCSEMSSSLQGWQNSPVGWGQNGVTVTDNSGFSYTFHRDEEIGPRQLNNNLTIILDTQEVITGKNFNKYGSFYYQGGSCRITLKLCI